MSEYLDQDKELLSSGLWRTHLETEPLQASGEIRFEVEIIFELFLCQANDGSALTEVRLPQYLIHLLSLDDDGMVWV